ncbi:hypothetical protein X777_14072, partial [Ooceraea biroi]
SIRGFEESLQYHLNDTHFKTVEEVQESIDNFIDSKLLPFSREEIDESENWRKIIENNSAYSKD